MTNTELHTELARLDRAFKTISPVHPYREQIELLFSSAKKTKDDYAYAKCCTYKAYLDMQQQNLTAAESLMQEAFEIAHKNSFDDLIRMCRADLSSILILRADYRTAYYECAAVLLDAEESGDQYVIAFLRLNLGIIARIYGADDEALEYLFSSLQLSKENNYIRLQGNCLYGLTQYYIVREDFRTAYTYGKQCLDVWTHFGDPVKVYNAEVQLVTILIELGEVIKAEKLITQLISKTTEKKPTSIATLEVCQGILAKRRKRYDDALTHFSAAIDIFSRHKREMLVMNTYIYICQLYMDRKKYDSAQQYAKKMYRIAKQRDDEYHIKQSYKLLYEINKHSGNIGESLRNLEKYNDVLQKNDRALLHKRVEFIQLKFEYDAKLEEAMETKRKAERLLAELQYKEKELTEKTRHLIRQTETISQFRNGLRLAIRHCPPNDPLFKQIKERMKSVPDTTMNWMDFNTEFQKVHPTFHSSLTAKFPKLTTMEMKICIVLRLGLSTPDAAKLLSLSERNIENHRYRIRKKLGLSTKVNLRDYLSELQ